MRRRRKTYSSQKKKISFTKQELIQIQSEAYYEALKKFDEEKQEKEKQEKEKQKQEKEKQKPYMKDVNMKDVICVAVLSPFLNDEKVFKKIPISDRVPSDIILSLTSGILRFLSFIICGWLIMHWFIIHLLNILLNIFSCPFDHLSQCIFFSIIIYILSVIMGLTGRTAEYIKEESIKYAFSSIIIAIISLIITIINLIVTAKT